MFCWDTGFWGYVEFGTGALAAQTEGTCLHVGSYVIQLTAPTVAVPAYANAAQAATATARNAVNGIRPQYVWASPEVAVQYSAGQSGAVQTHYTGQAAAAQTLYPAYDYSLFPTYDGNAQTYGML